MTRPQDLKSRYLSPQQMGPAVQPAQEGMMDVQVLMLRMLQAAAPRAAEPQKVLTAPALRFML